MPVVVSDTAPLNYLVWIGAAEVLPKLYGQILIPPAVWEELSHPKTPQSVQEWLATSPVWVHLAHPQKRLDSAFSHLGCGEQEAIALAMEQHANLLLIDERDGTQAARQYELTVIGTLGVLDQAAARGWISLLRAFNRLEQTSFRCPRALMSALLEEDRQRKKTRG